MGARLKVTKYTGKYGHPPRCEGLFEDGTECTNAATSIDHFTPRAIARRMGWSKTETESPENKQYLCEPCHERKDADTPERMVLLEQQLSGERSVPFQGHAQALKEAHGVLLQRLRERTRREQAKAG